MYWRLLGRFVLLLVLSRAAYPQTALHPSTAVAERERRAAEALETARANPLDLEAFLMAMPKGADLHNHLAGAVYAESWIRVAAEEHLCVSLASLTIVPPTAGRSDSAAQPDCGEGNVPASSALKNQRLYDQLVDAFSMRGFVPSAGITGHDQFFNTFARFENVYEFRLGDWLDEVRTRAAAQNEQYLELMHTPSFAHTATMAKEIGWPKDFPQLREKLLTRGFSDDLALAKRSLDEAESFERQREHCGQVSPSKACEVQMRYLCQILRGFPKEQVFAQTLFCFELASADRRYVGINMVMPEDSYRAMNDYDLQMRMVGFLHEIYPQVHISLHAGELAPGLVPYEGLCCHIRLAIEVAHAERIGHGIDVMYEERPYELLKEMAVKHVMTEINLTSNEVILGVRGEEHPLPIYRKYRVPVALSTDDEGVSRINLTHEFVRAVTTYGFHYQDLKTLVRTSLEHSFLEGTSLWSAPDDFADVIAACFEDSAGSETPSARCARFLRASEKAQQQWELERRFRTFESKF